MDALSITLIIIIITVLVSIGGFNNQKIIDDLIFYPPAITRRNQWYRFFSCGLIHADWMHLIFNMYAFYLFGAGQQKSGVEYAFNFYFEGKGPLLYGLMYVLALGVCLLPTYMQHRDNAYYRSLGASGAVSAVVFASVIFNPLSRMGLIFIPVYIPGFLFGIIYLVVSYALAKRGTSNINHSAHIWGALFGLVFVIVAAKLFSPYDVLGNFVNAIKSSSLSDLFTFG